MLTKIKRQDCLNKYPKFPLREYDFSKDDEKYFYPKIFKSYLLTLDSKSLKGHTILLASELSSLIKNWGFDGLIFLGDNKNYWLTKLSLSRNDYKPLENALQYLLDNKVGKRFNGALEIDNAELLIFIKHFFVWYVVTHLFRIFILWTKDKILLVIFANTEIFTLIR